MAAIPLAEFAAQIMATAGSPERVAAAAARVVENPIAIGPLRVGPAGVAKATAIGYIGEIRGRAATDDHWHVVVEVPVHVGVDVRFTRQRFRFGLEVGVNIRVRMVPTTGFSITVEIDEVTKDDVVAKIDAQDLPGKVVSLGYDLEQEVVAHVIDQANRLIAGPAVVAATHINVAEVIDRAWELGAILEHPPHALPAAMPADQHPVPPARPTPRPAPREPADEAVTASDEPTLAREPQQTRPMELPNHNPHTR